jgi:flagellar biogenesis protein FliO
MLNSLFEGYAFKMLFAFIVLLGVLALALWLVRRFGRERCGTRTPSAARRH